MKVALHFVEDGIDRHTLAHRDDTARICAEVEAEYAEQFANATIWQHIKLRIAIRREVARRMPAPPSPYNLYGKSR